MMATGIGLYKRTANLSESEPRMTSAWDGFKAGQLFEVPLHDSNQQYDAVSTGLVKVQPDRVNKGLVEWVNTLNDRSRSTTIESSEPRRLLHCERVSSVTGCAPHLLSWRSWRLLLGNFRGHLAAGR